MPYEGLKVLQKARVALQRPGGGPRKRYPRVLVMLASDFACLVKILYLLFVSVYKGVQELIRSYKGL